MCDDAAMQRAVVVGSGPNGLAGAITLARAGLAVRVYEAADRPGGGARSSEATLPGLVHDDASAAHPLAVVSPFFRDLDLGRHGLRFVSAEIELAHPLPGGRAALLWRDLDRTVDHLGTDGARWRHTVGWAARRFDALAGEVFRPILHVPRHPLTLGRFGALAALPASVLARAFRTEEAAALLTGVAAHGFGRLTAPFSSSIGVLLAAAGHVGGWPVAEGGSQAITDALLAELRDLGAEVVTGTHVRSFEALGEPDVCLLDTSPGAAAAILGDRLPARPRRAYRRWRMGPAAFKIDLAVAGPIPWTDPRVARAGTVHVGGTVAEMVEAEAATNAGRLPRRPFVLLGQQDVADPGRRAGDLHPVYLYAHVPNGCEDPTAVDVILDHVERYAPGLRDRIRHVAVTTPADLAARNPNLVGGDIAGGASSGRQLVFRPRIAADPYATGVPGVYLCSASTPPGAAVHGMGGYNAARRALRHLAARGPG